MPTERRGPVVLIGFDAGDPDLIERWTGEGHLPAIASLMARGTWTRTGGVDLLCEHGIWISLFGGVSWAQHGFHFFRHPVIGSYGLTLARGADFEVKPFWNELAGTGRKVFVLDPPDTGPVPGLSGWQVSEWATHSHYPPLSLAAIPAGAVGEIERRFGPREPIGETIGATVEQDRDTLERLLARVARKGKAVRDLLAQDRYELIAVTFAEAHTGGHQVWEYRRDAKGDGPRPAAGLGDGLLRLYQATDREIGALVAALPETADVVLVSSVGFYSSYPTEELLDSFCRSLGYHVAPGSGPAPEGRRSLIGMLRGLVPASAREIVNRLLPISIQSRLVSEKFAASADWSRTTAYSTPGYYTGTIRVNLRGREPLGTVEPGAEYEAVLDRLEADLHALRDAESGLPVVARTVRTRAVLPPPVNDLVPDLLVFWGEHDRPLTRVRHPRLELRQAPHAFHRGSHHTTTGFLVASGPSVRTQGRVDDVSPLAVAPTMLQLLGLPVPARMREAALAEWLVTPAAGTGPL
ncbi:MAG: hypothetical protein HOP28_04525 [Gemmatimonadales bacterium]|nr:hypothetical protein [Gemmatimonadales bacterium]